MSLDVLFSQLTSTRLALPIENTSLFNANDSNLEDSKTYNWRGARMSMDVGETIPVIYGQHLVAPQVINLYIEEGEHETLNMLLGVCEGEIEGISNIKVNGSAIENYYGSEANDPYGENAEISVRNGSLNQTEIENFGDIHNINPVSQTLVKGVAFEYTTDRDDVEAFKLELGIRRLFQTNDNNDMLAWYVSIKVEYRLHGTSPWQFLGIHEFSKKTESSFKRYFKSEYFTPNKYDIRVTRVSDNSDATHIGEVVLTSIDEIITQDLVYPATALLGLRLLASEKLAEAIPNITCVVKGIKVRVPDIKDGGGNPVAWEDYYWNSSKNAFCSLAHPDLEYNWDGITYITAWSANPVWCLRDILTHLRYGLGEELYGSPIDIADDDFLLAAKYCEEGVYDLNGKLEKRMRLDIVLDTCEDASDVIDRICSVFRGQVYPSAGRIRLLIEKQQNSVFTFNMSNIIKKSLKIRYASNSAIPNVLKLIYTNKDKNYQRDEVEVGEEEDYIAGVASNLKSVQFIGCTRLSQALREGKILLKKLKYNKIQINFSAGMDAVGCQVGNVFGFQHDLPAWGTGGRVKDGSTVSKIKLDKAIVLELGKTYEIEIRSGQNDKIERRIITDTNGSFIEVNVSSPFSFEPLEYDLWSFGEQNYVNKLYRLLSIDKGSDGVTNISALEYNALVYDYSGITIPKDNFKFLTLEIPNVSNLAVEEKVTRLPDGTIDDFINITFTRPPTNAKWVKRAVRFEIYLSDNNGTSWNFIGDTDKEFYTIKESFTKGHRYTVAVVSVSEDGEKRVPANSPQASLTIQGWKKSPAKVSGLSYQFSDEIKFKWDKNFEEDIAGYEIRLDRDNWGREDINFVWRGKAESYTVVRPTARDGVIYYIKAFNTSGIYSDEPAYITPINPAPIKLNLTFTNVFQKAMLNWSDSIDVDLVEYEIWQNNTDEWYGYTRPDERLIHKSKGTSALVLIPLNPTYFRIRGIDKFGPGEWSNSVRVPQVTLDGSLITSESITSVQICDNSISAPKIIAGSIQGYHIGAYQITVEKMNVACLSAISANLGKVVSGEIIGACIKTSEQMYRTELNNAGLFSYDSFGNLTIKLSDGQLCLINPDCSGFYSFLDHGALKFQHPYGSVPYLKRLCSGAACAGSTITLCQWYESPDVNLGIKKLASYDPAKAESCQEWCVYADNYRCYNNGGSDFGWKFDIHAKLVVSGGTRPECIYLVNFDITETTGVNTCLVLTKEMFQLWCHGNAPDTFKYGRSCYEVRYRVQGCGVWCACQYSYTQPHSTISEMTTTNVLCQTVQFGAGHIYEVQLHQVSLNWLDSGIQSGITCCYLCCYQYSCQFQVLCCYYCCCQACCSYQVDCSYWATCNVSASNCGFSYHQSSIGSCTTDQSVYVYFPAWSGCEVCQSIITYDYCGRLRAQIPTDVPGWVRAWVQVSGVGYGCVDVPISGIPAICDKTCYYSCHQVTYLGYYQSCLSGMVHQYTYGRESDFSYANTWVCNWCIYNISQSVCYKVCQLCTCWCYWWCYYWVCQWEWITCWYWCCYWYCCYYGAAETCIYEKFYSMQETTDTECILDPYGQINYLAVAYA